MICFSCLKIVSRQNCNLKPHLQLRFTQILGCINPVLNPPSSSNNVCFRRLTSSVPNFQENKLKEGQITHNKGGFAKAYDKFSASETVQEQVEQSFPSLLKSSKFIDLGDPEGKIVTGTIIHVVENDLYVDFGWKFHCVVSRPLKNEHEYVRGAKVRLILKDLELSSRFLGSEKDLTLLEADAILIGLISSPAKSGSTLTS